MYLLYLDESGNESDPADKHFVLAGAAVFEQTTFFLGKRLDDLQAKHFPGLPPLTFHASDIRSGRGFWRKVEEKKKQDVISEISQIIAQAGQGMVLFGAVIEKTDKLWGEVAIEHAAERICKSFDIFLMSKYHDENDPQRGLLIFSEGRFNQRARIWVQGFRERGTKWGALNNFSDIPYFASSKESRLLQIADAVAHAVFLLYERRDASLIQPFIHRFQQKNGTLHGLIHHRANRSSVCECPGCVSRATPNQLGPWLTPIPIP